MEDGGGGVRTEVTWSHAMGLLPESQGRPRVQLPEQLRTPRKSENFSGPVSSFFRGGYWWGVK